MNSPWVIFTLSLLSALAHPMTSSEVKVTPRTIEVHAQRFAFVPAEITVKKGETIILELISDDVPHSLLIKGLGINQAISKGHSTEVTFTPANTGDFHGQCGRFCGSGHGSMLFTVHVNQD
jgi:cytochrome c oxidase subunit 2